MKKCYAIKRKGVESYLLPMGAGGPTFSKNANVVPHIWATQSGVLDTMGRIAEKYPSSYDLDELEFVCFDLIPVRRSIL